MRLYVVSAKNTKHANPIVMFILQLWQNFMVPVNSVVIQPVRKNQFIIQEFANGSHGSSISCSRLFTNTLGNFTDIRLFSSSRRGAFTGICLQNRFRKFS